MQAGGRLIRESSNFLEKKGNRYMFDFFKDSLKVLGKVFVGWLIVSVVVSVGRGFYTYLTYKPVKSVKQASAQDNSLQGKDLPVTVTLPDGKEVTYVGNLRVVNYPDGTELMFVTTGRGNFFFGHTKQAHLVGYKTGEYEGNTLYLSGLGVFFKSPHGNFVKPVSQEKVKILLDQLLTGGVFLVTSKEGFTDLVMYKKQVPPPSVGENTQRKEKRKINL